MKNTTKTTVLCKALINNAKFTTKFVNKTTLGEQGFKTWENACNDLRLKAFEYYKGLALATSDEIIALEKDVYSALKVVLGLVGEIPTKDEKTTSKIPCNSLVFDGDVCKGTLFNDIIAIAVNRFAKIEKQKLLDLRQDKKTIMKKYKETCFNENGTPKNGIKQEVFASYQAQIDEKQTKIEKMLDVANNSIYGTTIAKKGKFIKEFEISLRKVVLARHNFTVEQVKQEKAQTKATRKSNRTKTDK